MKQYEEYAAEARSILVSCRCGCVEVPFGMLTVTNAPLLRSNHNLLYAYDTGTENMNMKCRKEMKIHKISNVGPSKPRILHVLEADR